MAGNRVGRVTQALKEEIGKILQCEIKDPRVKMATVTRAEITGDLRFAKVYFSIFGDKKAKEEAMAGIESAKGFIRHLIGQRMQLRYTPELSFRLDESSEYNIHIGKVLEGLKNQEEK